MGGSREVTDLQQRQRQRVDNIRELQETLQQLALRLDDRVTQIRKRQGCGKLGVARLKGLLTDLVPVTALVPRISRATATRTTICLIAFSRSPPGRSRAGAPLRLLEVRIQLLGREPDEPRGLALVLHA